LAEQDSNSGYNATIGWALLLIVLFVILWLIWHFHSETISNVIRWVRYGEMWLISLFVGDEYTVPYLGGETNWREGFELTPKISHVKTPEALSLFAALAMQPLKPVFSLFLVLAAGWAMFKGPGTQYRRKHNVESLLEFQSSNFPIIAPFVDFNPAEQPPRPPGSDVPAELPAFAEALGPEEWLAYNQIPVPDGVVNVKATKKAFKRQLGGRWVGVKGLRDYEKVLLAAFCLKAARKRGVADDLLGKLALCWSHKGGMKVSRKVLNEAQKVLRNRKMAEATLAECNLHAFKTSALIRALQYARSEGGVLAPSQFLWLRAVDRNLWYPLNNVGRQSLHIEAMGAMAHFKAERMTKRPIPVPKLDGAVSSISEYMMTNKARPIPALDYSQSKKRGIKKAI